VCTALYIPIALHKYSGPLLWGWRLPNVVRFYLADVVALPLELTLLLYMMRHWYFRRPSFVLPTTWIVGTWLVFGVWFEGILPRIDHRATADPLDVVAYAVGGFIFWRWLNRPA
jgi:hypothetical protein